MQLLTEPEAGDQNEDMNFCVNMVRGMYVWLCTTKCSSLLSSLYEEGGGGGVPSWLNSD